MRLYFSYMHPLPHPPWGAPAEGRGAWWGAVQHCPSSCPGHMVVHTSVETVTCFPCSETSGESSAGGNPTGCTHPSLRPHHSKVQLLVASEATSLVPPAALGLAGEQSQASPATLGQWMILGFHSPLSHLHPKLHACCCLLMLRAISIFSVVTAPWLVSGPGHICCLAGPHLLEEKLWGFHASTRHIE